MNWNLQSIGVPVVYRTMNPGALTEEERLDAYPSLGNPRCVNIWMTVALPYKFSQPELAWSQFLLKFAEACQSKGAQPFVLDHARRNRDEEVRNFLTIRRRRVRQYVEPLGLVTLPIFRSTHTYTRNENSWWLRSQARIISRIDGNLIGVDLQKNYKWLKTHTPEYRGSVSWNKWLQPGVLRVGWTTSRTEHFFWYEIRCPHMPGIDGNVLHLDDAAFDTHLDGIWLPLVRNIRWWSTSNPRTWEL